MNSVRQLTLLAAAAALVAAIIGATPASAAPNPSGSVVATGVVDHNGTPEAGVTVTAFAEPSPEALDAAGATGVRMLPLGQATTDPAGSFDVYADLSTAPAAYRNNDGGMDILVLATDATGQLSWNYTLYPKAGNVPAGSPVAPASTAEISATGLTATGELAPKLSMDLGSGVVNMVGNDPATWLDEQGTPLGALAPSVVRTPVLAPQTGLTSYATSYLSAGPAVQSAMLTETTSTLGGVAPAAITPAYAGIGCGMTYWTSLWKYGVREHYLNAYSFSGAKVTLEEGVSGSWSATLGVVAESSKGTLSGSGTVGKTWGGHVSQSGIVDASISNRINYRAQMTSCFPGRKWLPYSVADLITDITYAPHVNYSASCYARVPGATWTTESARNATWSSGVSFPGISVSAQSGYGTSQKMSFNFTSNGRICGNNAQGPVSSSQVSARA